MRVLVTGGSGYIGSHTCVQLLQNGHDVIILDNLCNSKRSVLPVIERLGGKHPTFVEGDIRNEALPGFDSLYRVFVQIQADQLQTVRQHALGPRGLLHFA